MKSFTVCVSFFFFFFVGYTQGITLHVSAELFEKQLPRQIDHLLRGMAMHGNQSHLWK